ncbi:hypothetical protein FB451DRAFT_1409080 [Mycena latifolia]|nr:hypothetical protein FB451DRAFT_1409080 [Mycena latifolia]
MGHAAVLGPSIDYLVCYLITVCPSNLPASLSEGVRPVAATSWLFTCPSSSLIPARLPTYLFLLVSLSHDADKYDAASARVRIQPEPQLSACINEPKNDSLSSQRASATSALVLAPLALSPASPCCLAETRTCSQATRARPRQVATTTKRTAPLRAVNLLHPPLLPSDGLYSPLGWRVYATAAKGLACDRWDYYPALLVRPRPSFMSSQPTIPTSHRRDRARAVSWSRCDHLVYCPDLPLTLSCNGTHVVRARDARLRTAQVRPARRTRRAPHAARAEMPAHSRRVVRARLAVEGAANASPCSALRKLAGTQIRPPLAPAALHSRAPAPNPRTALAACCRHSSDDAPRARRCVHCLDVRPQERQPGERDASCCTPLPAFVQHAVYATRSIIALHKARIRGRLCARGLRRSVLRTRLAALRKLAGRQNRCLLTSAAHPPHAPAPSPLLLPMARPCPRACTLSNALDVRPCLRFALAGGGEDDPASATQARRRVRTVAGHSARYSRWCTSCLCGAASRRARPFAAAAGGGVRPHPLREVRMCGCVLFRDAVIPGARRCRAISTLRSLEGAHIASAGA